MKKEVATKKTWSRLKEAKSKEEIHVATPKGDKRCRDITLRS